MNVSPYMAVSVAVALTLGAALPHGLVVISVGLCVAFAIGQETLGGE